MTRAERPMWVREFQSEGTKIHRIRIDGKRYSYTVVKEEVANIKGLPYHTTYDPLIITENVPENFRRFVLAHEIRENNWSETLPQEERCRAALVAELEEVEKKLPKGQVIEYVQERIDYFEHIIPFHEGAKSRDKKFIEGKKRSLDFLKEYNSQIPS